MKSRNIDARDLEAILASEHPDPFEALGCHEVEGGAVIRAFQPDAREVAVYPPGGGEPVAMERIHDAGVFETFLPDTAHFLPTMRATSHSGQRWDFVDPYSFPPLLGDQDLHYHSEGSYVRAYDKMGCHPIEFQGVEGASFAVWAPTARRVAVVGDFNNWDGRRHPMRRRGGSGVWELFVPGVRVGEVYKYEIRTQSGELLEKADPYAFCSEKRPQTASVIWNLDCHDWKDQEWMEARREFDALSNPMSVYEIHLGSWARVPEEGNRQLRWDEMAERLVAYVKSMGYTHVELLPIAEHPFGGSWGYQITSFFAPTRRFGTPDGLAAFVDYMHRNGIGVILDWVPAHFPKDPHALARYDGTCLYEHEDPRQGEHRDWGTLIFNYGRNEVRDFLISNALFWLDKYHIDGLRVDAVASMLYLDYSREDGEWVANKYGGRENLEAVEFLKQLNETVHEEYPGVLTIAEESTAWPGVSRPVYTGGLGFTLKWNMGWMHDTLAYMQQDPVYRRWHHSKLTFSLLYAFTENFTLVLSHDEVVHMKGSLVGKMPGDEWQRFANLRVLFGYMYGHPGKKLLFMGGDLGQVAEWNHQQSLDWHLLEEEPHRGLNTWVRDLNRLYTTEPALHEVDHEYDGFQWIDFRDSDNSVISFLRKARPRRVEADEKPEASAEAESAAAPIGGEAPATAEPAQEPGDVMVVALNFTPLPRPAYRIGVPREGFYHEVLNSDSYMYWGSNVGNEGGVWAEPIAWHEQPWSIAIDLPPLAAVYLKPSESPDVRPVELPPLTDPIPFVPPEPPTMHSSTSPEGETRRRVGAVAAPDSGEDGPPPAEAAGEASPLERAKAKGTADEPDPIAAAGRGPDLSRIGED